MARLRTRGIPSPFPPRPRYLVFVPIISGFPYCSTISTRLETRETSEINKFKSNRKLRETRSSTLRSSIERDVICFVRSLGNFSHSAIIYLLDRGLFLSSSLLQRERKAPESNTGETIWRSREQMCDTRRVHLSARARTRARRLIYKLLAKLDGCARARETNKTPPATSPSGTNYVYQPVNALYAALVANNARHLHTRAFNCDPFLPRFDSPAPLASPVAQP